MARGLFLFHTLLSAIFLIILTLDHSLSAAQSGFQSINCGGTAYKDSNNISWEADILNANDAASRLYGRSGTVDSSLQNIPYVMKTLRYFPKDPSNIKFCYILDNISDGRVYLLRASFLYGNYDKLNQPPAFVLLFNYNKWKDVSTSSSSIPIVHELTFLSTGNDVIVCLAAAYNSSQTPFISTLELRPLNQTMYMTTGGALTSGFGLMLSHRINYGASSSAVIRYPTDPFDRIWEANTTGPIEFTSNMSNVGTFYGSDPEGPPQEVMATAITTQNSKSNLSFTYEDFGGTGGVRIEMHFQEVNEAAFEKDGARDLGLYFASYLVASQQSNPILPALGGPIPALLDTPGLQLPSPLSITIFPLPHSPGGPLLNAIELFQWTPQNLSATPGTFQDDAHTIMQVQTHFNLMGYGQGDPCTPSDYPWSWIKCNTDLQPKIIEIHLASLNLKGDIPPFINNLTFLQKIDLSNNTLNGEIPDFYHLQDLEYLDLHNNKLNGSLPQSLLSLDKLSYLNVAQNELCGSTSSFQGLKTKFISNDNPKLCNDANCNCSTSSTSPTLLRTPSCSKTKYIYAISFLGALYIVTMLTLFLIYMAKRSKQKKDGVQGLPFLMKKFTYTEIRNATLDFSNFIGEGGFGKVYHGLLSSGEVVAVKLLEAASKQGLKEFSTEVAILSRVRHKNLVSLIGYCMENSYMLIYEYVAKGNLRDLIYGDVESSNKPLTWNTRLQIALDASQGLEYLHTGSDPAIIHRDVKSSNILLTDKMQGKVSDFGLSRLKEGGSTVSHVSTVNVVGTAGYLDPAYNATNQLTDKSDVYSFGVVLFELICGRAPIDMFRSPPHIVDWVTPAIVKGRVEDIVDPMLPNGYKVESMWKVIDLAFGCVETDRLQRLNMSQVVRVLREALEIEMEPQLEQDVSGSSATSDGKLPNLQYIESLRMRLEPR